MIKLLESSLSGFKNKGEYASHNENRRKLKHNPLKNTKLATFTSSS